MKILFVCTGNICRSPMAEAMLVHSLAFAGSKGTEVSSAGTWAGDGDPPTPLVLTTLADHGIDPTLLEGSTPLTAVEAEASDLIIAMTSVHEREIESLAPGSGSKIRLAKEFAEFGQPSGETPHQRLERLLASARPPPRRSLDLDDPIGLPTSAYERVFTELLPAVALLSAICEGSEGSMQ